MENKEFRNLRHSKGIYSLYIYLSLSLCHHLSVAPAALWLTLKCSYVKQSPFRCSLPEELLFACSNVIQTTECRISNGLHRIFLASICQLIRPKYFAVL